MSETKENELLPDENYFQHMIDFVLASIKKIKSDIVDLENKDENIFLRYLAFYRIKNIADFMQISYHSPTSLMAAGFAINHKLLNNEETKRQGWDIKNLDLFKTNSFFNQIDDLEHSLIDELSKIENLLSKENDAVN